ncbi:MAG: flagellar hook-length control protein FliK [Rhodocyclaceae bacterium]|nr:flagellar hook-length control protein FliK [Rhodocyclaceae bacterium]MCP5231385.1 flagellar hook-length control protein FliK [Zoogloeaceae bacterium]MCB1911415.1 flagellar hook-length control protein FliK [Rhodocyclaceae bacterium]MCP5240866.1 flagellar hook-length control protein FliK [Zoogloeaceae bacterium]MCP5255306.1 flagellar hook-length control protein FliK [Zoogloeaceae bacterium]
MIPADLTSRLRMLTEASFFSREPPEVGAPSAVKPIAGDLPEFLPGQKIIATLQEARDNGVFRAQVDGKQVNLSLQGTSAKAGDVLNLVVTRATPSTVIATLASAAPDTASTSLSQTGKLISFLLTGQPSPQPASLAANQPLLQAPPTAGQALAPLLKQAISESGLFYESHQARWLSGETDAATLMREPQGRSPAAGTQPPATGAAATAGTTASSAATGTTSPTPQAAGALAEGEAATVQRAEASSAAQARAAAPIPDRLLPVVHQQLDALATNHYAWQGMAWPGQRVEWDIDDPSGDSAGEDPEAAQAGWRSSLRLTLPKLGAVEARLHLTDAGVSLHFVADEDAAEPLRRGRAELAEALAQASVPMTGMSVEVTAPGADHGET